MALGFELFQNVVDGVALIIGQVKRFNHSRIAFHHLARRKTQRYACSLRMVFNQVNHGMNTTVHGTSMVGRATEVGTTWSLLVACHMNGVIHQFLHTFVFGCRNRHNWYSEAGFKLIDVDSAAIVAHLVHHIQSKHHRYAQFHQLHGQIQVALNVGGVHNVDDALWLGIENELARHYFLARVRRKRIDAGQVHHLGIGVSFDNARLAVDGHARKITHMLIRTSERIKQRGLAAVLITHKCKSDFAGNGGWIFLAFGMVAAFLAQTGVFCACRGLFSRLMWLSAFACGANVDVDFRRIVFAERQFVAMDKKLHRVAHRCEFHQSEFAARNHTHIKEVLTECAVTSHLSNNGRLANFQFI